MPRPIQARIDLSAIRHNYGVAKAHAARSGGALWAAVAWASIHCAAGGRSAGSGASGGSRGGLSGILTLLADERMV